MSCFERLLFIADSSFSVDVVTPWIVLEYLPHGDLKNFLIVSTHHTV